MKINLLEVPVVVINLDSEPEKRTATMEMLVSLGFKTIARVSAQPIAPYFAQKVTAVAKSHLDALSVFAPPFIVLEDDVVPLNWESEVAVPDDAEAVSLGNMQWGYTANQWVDYPVVEPAPEGFSAHKIVHMVGGHAWLYLSTDFVEKFKEVCELSSSAKIGALAQDCRASRDLYPTSCTYVLAHPLFAQQGKYSSVTNLGVEEYRATNAPGFHQFFNNKKGPGK